MTTPGSGPVGELYFKQPFVEELRAKRFSFLLVAKPGDHTSLYEDVAGLRRGNRLHRHHTDHRGERRVYEWVTARPAQVPNGHHLDRLAAARLPHFSRYSRCSRSPGIVVRQ